MTESNPRNRRWLILGGIFIVLVAAAIAVFFTIGRWLVVQDPLVHADVLVVLSGRLPERAEEAARLFRAGYADQVWISAPTSPEQALKAMKISFLGEDFYNEKVLLAQGVPADSIRVMARPSANTEEEVRQIAENLRSMDYHTAVLVTSKAHTRRVHLIWRRLVGSEPRLIVRYASDDSYDGAHWWRHTRDALDVVRETLGLCNAWAGFPLRPRED
ncbi:MAG TPA: YdcF family protein [Candidatus Acidoferrales bacterium]|nr:YdcF family protein [Candidatus Acidoferrales bacterium]